MTSWNELSRDAHLAAIKLGQLGHFRSSVSRAYYAAFYSAAALYPTHQYRVGWNNPDHAQVLSWLKTQAPVPKRERYVLHSIYYFLLQRRIDADYRPGIGVTSQTAKECRMLSTSIAQLLERAR